jgi:hypothetical protein
MDSFFGLIVRLNAKLDVRKVPPMSNLSQDLSDGTNLIQLMVSYLTK